MDKHDVLANTNFGQRIAEDEADALAGYFVETDQWYKILRGDVDIVYGPKGSGKSALYSLLRERQGDLLDEGLILAPCETFRGAPVFQDLVTDPPASEEQFRGLWKLYFLSLIGTAFRTAKFETEHSRVLLSVLESAGLVLPEFSLRRSLRSALDYVRRIDSLSAGVKLNPAIGLPEGVEAKVTLREPGEERRRRGYLSADELLQTADRALVDGSLKFWLVLDRLDVAFPDSPKLEGNALRALFRVYRDMADLRNISVKIFLRDDIWRRITSSGFREASHITRSITITWDAQSLLNLVICRALHNGAVCEFYGVNPPDVLGSAEEQKKLFYRIFPAQVDPGARRPTTLDWMLSRTMDGSGKTAPRELIHLLSSARDQQLKKLEMGEAAPPGESLFDRSALKAALPEVSRARYEQTLCAEYPGLKQVVDRLEGEKSQQSIASLAKIWGLSQAEAQASAEKLAEVGFFQKRGLKEEPIYWVPFLYRDALNLVQGQAEE
jgi:hypothetical protein